MDAMKKFIALFMSLVCVVCALGCGSDSKESSDISAIGDPSGKSASFAGTLVKAVYPDQAALPLEDDFVKENGEFDFDAYEKAYQAYNLQNEARQNALAGYNGELDGFFSRSILQFLCDGSEGEHVFSPVNIYLALALLAEVTDHNSRAQILDLVGADSIEDLRTQAAGIWTALYQDNIAIKCLLGNSIWLRDDTEYNKDTLEKLASYYYASSFSGKMGDEAFSQALRDWINEQTGDLLKDSAKGLSFTPDTVCALASTLYFKGKWSDEFDKGATAENVFHGEEGDENRPFMKSSELGTYWKGSNYSAVKKSFESSDCNMWFFLPDEDVSVDEMLNDREMQSFLLSADKYSFEGSKDLTINLSVPKFDVSCDLDLKDGLIQMGVSDVFDYNVSDFSPLTQAVDKLFVSSAKHSARVMIDEEGCEAAAFTVMMVEGAGMLITDEIDFVLDRPFFFAVTGAGELPLFAGIIK